MVKVYKKFFGAQPRRAAFTKLNKGMDTYYRQYHLTFGKSLTVGNDHLDDLFKQVAERAGIGRASLWKIEKGEGIDIDIFIGGNRYGVIDLKKYTGCWRNNRN